MRALILGKLLSISAMTRRTEGTFRSAVWLVLFLSLTTFVPRKATSQFLDLQLQVESRLTATTERPLNFGVLSSNTGTVQIELGDVNMGIFSVTALERQILLVELNTPDQLNHDNPAIDEPIPLNLNARYGYSTQNVANSYPLAEATNTLRVATNPDPGPWNTLYIFVFGSITIGEVPDGMYSNRILLNVEYI